MNDETCDHNGGKKNQERKRRQVGEEGSGQGGWRCVWLSTELAWEVLSTSCPLPPPTGSGAQMGGGSSENLI